jgi:hypothetical protein
MQAEVIKNAINTFIPGGLDKCNDIIDYSEISNNYCIVLSAPPLVTDTDTRGKYLDMIFKNITVILSFLNNL